MMNILAHATLPDDPPFAPTLAAAIRHASTHHGERVFLISGDARLTFAEVDRRSAALARGLLALGLGKGARVGILMPNDIDWVIGWFAVARMGGVAIAMSTLYRPPELAWALRHNDIDTLLVADRYLSVDFTDRLEQAVPGLAEQQGTRLALAGHPYLRRIVMWGSADRRWAMHGPADIHTAAAEFPAVNDAFLESVEGNVAPADDLIVISTSGTTAEPKAVIHTNGTAIRTTWAFLQLLDLRPDDRTYVGSPFFWIAGLNITVLPSLYAGAAICFAPTPQVGDVLAMVKRDRVTRLSMHSTQVRVLIDAAAPGDIDSVRTWHDSARDREGGLIPPELRRGWMFGMTETFGPHTMEAVNIPAPPGKGGCLGLALPGIERRVVDPATGAEVLAGQRGELIVRGYTLMRGYHKKEREQVFTRDGYFATGDIVSIDSDGYMYFHGRLSDAIKTSGANVAPLEVEQALEGDPSVREAIVFGVPDAVKGERVVAVVIGTGDAIDINALAARLRADLSSFKVPTEIVQMDDVDIPRTAPGKPMKKRLAERFVAGTPT